MAEKIQILVVDDETGIREGCRRVLEPLGYVIETATSLRQGQEKLTEQLFELVLLDVMLPDGQGIDLLAHIQARDPNTVCVIITGYATVDLAVRAIRQGAYDFISKPFTADILQLTVEQGLEHRRLSLETSRLQEVEQKAQELARLDRFKNEFILTITHELRSPVGGAQSLLRALLHNQAGALNEQQQTILERVSARMDTLMSLINDLLDLAAARSVTPREELETLDVRPQLERILARFQTEAESGRVDLTAHLAQIPGQVHANHDGLEKILTNLIGNAIKYTPAGGRVRVSLHEADHHLCITVQDTGIGIPQEALAQLGEEFFRAPNAKHTGIPGTGLGLSIVRRLVEHFGGRLEVESTLGLGSTFRVFLPLAESLAMDTE